MKKIIFFASIVVTLFACKEQLPVGLDLNIINNITDTLLKDTTYITAVRTPQTKVILIEESTGNKCSNCPAGAAQIEQMIHDNPGRIKLMALHFAGLEVDEPAEKYYSLENQDVKDLIAYLDGDQGQPCASFDRTNIAGKYFILRGSGGNWTSAISSLLPDTVTPINIHLTSVYNAASNEVTLTSSLAFTDTTSQKLFLSIFVLEDGLVGAQDSSAFPSVLKIEDYVSNNVLRKAITPVIGTPILDSLVLKEEGRVVKKAIIFKPNSIWNLDKCKILAVVHKSETNDKHVIHVAEVDLK